MRKYIVFIVTLVVIVGQGVQASTVSSPAPIWAEFPAINDVNVDGNNFDSVANVNFNDGSTQNTSPQACNSGESLNSGGCEAFANADVDTAPRSLWEDYISPDGMVIANADNPKIGIDLQEGGAIYVDSVGSNDTSIAVVNVNSTDTAFDITKTGCGGLVNSSTRSASSWYELGWAIDKEGTNPPCIVGWTHTSSTDSAPTTVSELPSGYELLRAMGSPGKTWWLRTDGSSNIREFVHRSNGWIEWTTTTLNAFNQLEDANSDDENFNIVDISNQVPPVGVELEINHLRGRTDGTGVANIEVASDNNTVGISDGHISMALPGGGGIENQNGSLKGVFNQEIFWVASNASSNLSRFQIQKIASFRSVN